MIDPTSSTGSRKFPAPNSDAIEVERDVSSAAVRRYTSESCATFLLDERLLQRSPTATKIRMTPMTITALPSA